MNRTRLAILGCGTVLVALLGSVAVWDVVRGTPVFDAGSYPDAARLSGALLVAGLVMVAAAWTGSLRLAALLAACVPFAVAAALAVNAADGDPLSTLWRPVSVGLVVLVPAAALLLTGQRRRRSGTRRALS